MAQKKVKSLEDTETATKHTNFDHVSGFTNGYESVRPRPSSLSAVKTHRREGETSITAARRLLDILDGCHGD